MIRRRLVEGIIKGQATGIDGVGHQDVGVSVYNEGKSETERGPMRWLRKQLYGGAE